MENVLKTYSNANLRQSCGYVHIYSFKPSSYGLDIDLEMYGTQVVEIKGAKPSGITSFNPGLKILGHEYKEQTKILRMTIHGRDMQGERGMVNVVFWEQCIIEYDVLNSVGQILYQHKSQVQERNRNL